MTPKDKRIIEHAEKTGTPIFVLTAKDAAAIKTIEDYKRNCSILGCNETHISGISSRINDFLSWTVSNPDKVKLPD